tara:strand:- start:651 stop:893 length:243 start_codon:yes stop_codon:yes gene_type:complete
MKISNDSFGGRSNFSVGDVVYWTYIGKKLTGVISNLRNTIVGGRKVVYADIFCFESCQNCEVLTLNLKVLSKSDSNQHEN